MTRVGTSLQPRSIAVFRALMLGDMLCATPALRAIRATWPRAAITLVGLPWAQALVQRLDSVDDFEPFPGWPGLAEQPVPDPHRLEVFLQHMRSRRFDLVIQLHGSGSVVNAMLAQWGARDYAGFYEQNGIPPSAAGQETFLPWPMEGHEIQRLLALAGHLGLADCGAALDLPLSPADYQLASALLPQGGRYAMVHAGSQLPSRRWPARHFAAVADRLVQAGLQVVLTGTAAESELVDSVAGQMLRPCTNLCGKTDIWTLGALLDGASILVCNDTGVSHMAAALGTPSVVAACGSDTARWAPLDPSRHRVLWHALDCRPCAYRDCPIGHPCAWGLPAERVIHTALQLACEGPI